MNQMIRQGRTALFEQASDLFQIMLALSQVIYSEGYCILLDYLELAYYPVSNRTPGGFTQEEYLTIESLTEQEAHEFTGFSKRQLHRLFVHWRLPQTMSYPRRATFTGEQCLIRYFYHIRKGATKLQMARIFGGDPRKFTYVMRLMTNHLYTNFYHKISGNSMGMWRSHIRDFRYAIWDRLRSGATHQETTLEPGVGHQQHIFLDIPFESFRIFGFLDDTGIRTNAPGIEARRTQGFFHDIQRSFYRYVIQSISLCLSSNTPPDYSSLQWLFCRPWCKSTSRAVAQWNDWLYLSSFSAPERCWTLEHEWS
jgi:hypothetical protein